MFVQLLVNIEYMNIFGITSNYFEHKSIYIYIYTEVYNAWYCKKYVESHIKLISYSY